MADNPKMSKSEFQKAFQREGVGKVWKEARKKGVATQMPPDGVYVAQLSKASYGMAKNGGLYVNYNFIVRSDDETLNGARLGKFFSFKVNINPKTKKPYQFQDNTGATVVMDAQWIAGQFAKDMANLGVEGVEDMPDADVVNALDQLGVDKPIVRITLKGSDTQFPKIYINGLVQGADAEAARNAGSDEEEESESEDDETESEDEEESDLDDEESETEEDEDAEAPPDEEYEQPDPEPEQPKKPAAKPKYVKGGKVKYDHSKKGKPALCTIMAVGKDGTLTLRRELDKHLFKGVDPKAVKPA